MNGQPPISSPASGLPAALLVSCLLHLTLMGLSYWGVSLHISGHGSSSRTVPSFLIRRLNVTLAPPRRAATPSAPTSAPAPSHPEMSVATLVPAAAPDRVQPSTSEVTSSHAGKDILPLKAQQFYPTDQLSLIPEPTEFKDMDTPESSSIIASGRMVLKLWIDEQGEVVHVLAEKSGLPPALIESAIRHFQQMRFIPGERYGQRVGVLMNIEIHYDDPRATSPPALAMPQP